jgi:AP endonuclease-2
MFKDGKRLRKYSMKDLQPLSGKLIPEFDRRRNIKDMFSRKPSVTTAPSTESPSPAGERYTICRRGGTAFDYVTRSCRTACGVVSATAQALPPQSSPNPASPAPPASPANSTSNKRSLGETSTNRPLKRSKSVSTSAQATTTGKGQQSLKGFFKPKLLLQTVLLEMPTEVEGKNPPAA